MKRMTFFAMLLTTALTLGCSENVMDRNADSLRIPLKSKPIRPVMPPKPKPNESEPNHNNKRFAPKSKR